jgi:hypothetical protein
MSYITEVTNITINKITDLHKFLSTVFYKNTVGFVDISGEVVQQPASTIDKVLSWLLWSLGIILALFAASIVANHLITHPWQIRLVVFIFVLIGSLLSSGILIPVLFYYVFLALARTYYNSTLKSSDTHIPLLPTLFTFLPITTYIPQSWSARVLYYPFSYDPTSQYVSHRLELEKNIATTNAMNSFYNFNTTTEIGGFKQLFDMWTNGISVMHQSTVSPLISTGSTT